MTPDILSVCHQCGSPCNQHTNCANRSCSHFFIQCPTCRETHRGTSQVCLPPLIPMFSSSIGEGTCGKEECVQATSMSAEELREYLRKCKASSFPQRTTRRLPFALPFPATKI